MQDLYSGRLLCSRICHDLITPVGAVLSGLELLEEQKDGDYGEIIDLLRLSAAECARRLMLYRFAFGVGAASTLSSLNEIQNMLSQAVDPKKYTYTIDFPEAYMADQALLKVWAQLLANLFSVSLEALPYGGSIAVSTGNQLDPQLQLILSGRLITLHEDVRDIIQNSRMEDELSPRTIQAYLVQNLSSQVARKVNVVQRGEELVIQTQNT
jgi:histidine phosphotransferase ChpT